MDKATCTEVDCESAVVARGLCSSHYQKGRRAGLISKLDTSHQHKLSDVDVENARAVCSICGPTRIRVRRGRTGHQCWTLRQAEYRQRYPRDRSGWASTIRSPESRRDYRLRSKYGITLDDYAAMLAAQGGVCAICGTESLKPLSVDHDHATGKVRALLCNGCNTGIGHLREDEDAIRSALDYLKRHSS